MPVFIVLHDPVAITIDQGNIAEAYQQQILDIKAKEQESKEIASTGVPPKKSSGGKQSSPTVIPKEMKLDSSKIKSLSAEFHRKRVIFSIIKNNLKRTYPKAKDLPKEREKNKYVINILTNKKENPKSKRHLEHIKLQELKTFAAELDTEENEIKKIEADILKATNDHKVILLTMELDKANHPSNLASVYRTYNRKNVNSAVSLEKVIAVSMRGIGVPSSDNEEEDKRFKLLGKWIEQEENSPLYLGLKAFEDFETEIDSAGVADLIDSSKTLAEELYKKMPFSIGTERIVQETIVYDLKRSVRKWEPGKRLLINTNPGKKLEKLFKIIIARYGITDGKYYFQLNDGLTRQASMSDITKIYIGTINNTKNVTGKVGENSAEITKRTNTRKSNNTVEGLAKIGEIGIPVGVAAIHAYNLWGAIKYYSEDKSSTRNLNTASASIGFLGAFIEVATFAVHDPEKFIHKVPGKIPAAIFAKLILWKVVSKMNLVGAALDVVITFVDTKKLLSKGDNDAAFYSVAGGVVGMAGGGLMVVGAKGLAATAFIPGIGWRS